MKHIVLAMLIVVLLASCKFDSPTGGSGGSTYLELVGQYIFEGEPVDADIDGATLLVLTAYHRLQTWDITNPDAVWLDASVTCLGTSVNADGDLACVANGQGFSVWDISQSWSPLEVSGVTFSGAQDVAVDGGYAYAASQSNGLRIYDISDPWQTPYDVGECWSASNAHTVTVNGGYAYLLHDYGMYQVDVTPPSNPLLTSDFTVSSPNDVALRGQFAYIAHDFGLTVVDISDPWNPNSVSSFASYSPFKSIALSGSFAFACAGSNELMLFDISDPYAPEHVDTFYTMDTSRKVVTDGVYIYVICDGFIEVLRLDAWR